MVEENFPVFGAGGGLDVVVVDLTILLSNTDFLLLLIVDLCSITLRLVASLADFGGVAGCCCCGGEDVPDAAVDAPALDLDTTVRPVKLAPIPYLLLLVDFLTVFAVVVVASFSLLLLEGVVSEGEIFLT